MAKETRRPPVAPKPAVRRPVGGIAKSAPARLPAETPAAFDRAGVSAAAVQAAEAVPAPAAAALARMEHAVMETAAHRVSPIEHAAHAVVETAETVAEDPQPVYARATPASERMEHACEPTAAEAVAAAVVVGSTALEPRRSGSGSALASSYGAALKGMAEINGKALDSLCANSVSTLRFIESLMGAKTFADVLRLQAEHSRKHFEAVSDQATELTALARKMADASARPLQARLLGERKSA